MTIQYTAKSWLWDGQKRPLKYFSHFGPKWLLSLFHPMPRTVVNGANAYFSKRPTLPIRNPKIRNKTLTTISRKKSQKITKGSNIKQSCFQITPRKLQKKLMAKAVKIMSSYKICIFDERAWIVAKATGKRRVTVLFIWNAHRKNLIIYWPIVKVREDLQSPLSLLPSERQ